MKMIIVGLNHKIQLAEILTFEIQIEQDQKKRFRQMLEAIVR